MSREESLFFYPGEPTEPAVMGRRKRQTYEEYQNFNFVPIFLDELTFTDDQKVICEGDLQCLFDLAVTGDVEFANTTLMEGKIANETIKLLGMYT